MSDSRYRNVLQPLNGGMPGYGPLGYGYAPSSYPAAPASGMSGYAPSPAVPAMTYAGPFGFPGYAQPSYPAAPDFSVSGYAPSPAVSAMTYAGPFGSPGYAQPSYPATPDFGVSGGYAPSVVPAMTTYAGPFGSPGYAQPYYPAAPASGVSGYASYPEGLDNSIPSSAVPYGYAPLSYPDTSSSASSLPPLLTNAINTTDTARALSDHNMVILDNIATFNMAWQMSASPGRTNNGYNRAESARDYHTRLRNIAKSFCNTVKHNTSLDIICFQEAPQTDEDRNVFWRAVEEEDKSIADAFHRVQGDGGKWILASKEKYESPQALAPYEINELLPDNQKPCVQAVRLIPKNNPVEQKVIANVHLAYQHIANPTTQAQAVANLAKEGFIVVGDTNSQFNDRSEITPGQNRIATAVGANCQRINPSSKNIAWDTLSNAYREQSVDVILVPVQPLQPKWKAAVAEVKAPLAPRAVTPPMPFAGPVPPQQAAAAPPHHAISSPPGGAPFVAFSSPTDLRLLPRSTGISPLNVNTQLYRVYFNNQSDAELFSKILGENAIYDAGVKFKRAAEDTPRGAETATPGNNKNSPHFIRLTPTEYNRLNERSPRYFSDISSATPNVAAPPSSSPTPSTAPAATSSYAVVPPAPVSRPPAFTPSSTTGSIISALPPAATTENKVSPPLAVSPTTAPATSTSSPSPVVPAEVKRKWATPGSFQNKFETLMEFIKKEIALINDKAGGAQKAEKIQNALEGIITGNIIVIEEYQQGGKTEGYYQKVYEELKNACLNEKSDLHIALAQKRGFSLFKAESLNHVVDFIKKSEPKQGSSLSSSHSRR